MEVCWRASKHTARMSLALAIAALPSAAYGYIPGTRWSTTASGSTGSTGDSITLTWSIVDDGTSIPNETSSRLIAFLDAEFGAGQGGSDYRQRPWFSLFEDSFERWRELGGINFVYEPNDNGVQLGTAGSLGVRGDIRIGGTVIRGSASTLAYANYPNNGDIVIDTAEGDFFDNPNNNYRAFRNTLMHEIGHAFGLDHVESSTDRLLMEPFIDTNFDGPQLDDVRGIQGQYGDAYEQAFSGQGNDAAARATSLGAIAAGATRFAGRDAAGSQEVAGSETDFVSIANASDFDYFSFSVSAPSTLDAMLTPLGGVFNQGAQGGTQSSFNANARNDLTLNVYNTNGTSLLATANAGAAGASESIADLALPTAGQYYVRISGASSSVQLYQLQLSVESVADPSADFDGDNDVDGADFLIWQRNVGSEGVAAGDANSDGLVNGTDLTIFREQFGDAGAVVASAPVPEPAAVVLAAFAGLFCLGKRRWRPTLLRDRYIR